MKLLLRLEQAAALILAIWLCSRLDVAWWWFPLLLFVPDVSMAGYVAGPRVGALTYNIVHHQAVAIGCYLAGALLGVTWLQVAGLVLLAHSALDRVLGYGLKYPDSFNHTHLGRIGAAREETAREGAA